MAASEVLRAFALSIPSQAATILRVLHNVASIHIAETRAVHCNDDDRISAVIFHIYHRHLACYLLLYFS